MVWMCCWAAWAVPLKISDSEARSAGMRVWQNECGGRIDGLTSWNQGEDFASLGIGHFIWYPKNRPGPFEESFPKLVEFLRAQNVAVPDWMQGPCPWSSRQAFLDDFQGPRLQALRQILAQHVALQARFIAQRLEGALPKMLEACPQAQREVVKTRFYAVIQSPGGVYALLDYVNFKGEGVKATESYDGKGWGLLQVLQEAKPAEFERNPLGAFAASAESVLRRRVDNSPPARNEGRWLTGWLNRVRRYRQ